MNKRILATSILAALVLLFATLSLGGGWSSYTALEETPADGDILSIIDIDDVTMSANGTNKKITYSNFMGDTVKWHFAEAYLDDNSAWITIFESNSLHCIPTVSEGISDEHIEFKNGFTQAVTAWADAGGGNVTVTSVGIQAAGLAADDYVCVNNTTNYNGIYQVVSVSTDSFVITHSFDGNDAQGQATKPFSFKVVSDEVSGIYSVEAKGDHRAELINTGFRWSMVKNGEVQTKGRSEAFSRLATSIDTAILKAYYSLGYGDEIFVAIENTANTGNMLVSYGYMYIKYIGPE